MRIAVTGGSGDLGRNLVAYLLEQGHAVVSIDRALPPMPTTWPARRAEHMVADTRDFGQIVAAIRGCDALIHLAAHRSPGGSPDTVVYTENTAGSYNALSAAATLGITRVCLASSINAIGGAFSRAPRYDYFPLDEQHPTYAEDPYSLSKWVLEQQADAFARRYEQMRIASLRFHWLVESRQQAVERTAYFGPGGVRHLWAYTLLAEASRACLLAITADFQGHEVFYIAAPNTAMAEPSLDLARQHYADVPVRGDLSDHRSFFDCSKAERLLGWSHSSE
ncbi:MAG TPA: NAD(P)-dependent oxidoreductase [Kouleothrix sp.]|uniref:NAD-dependent epimerase/dehydratase family protein n=1 Tax=Kouleothrix sp. TaxID=2779161 RepID=UPI002C7A8E54|nr:NAD(P)-dependent oxidoreductase [Kouleothrix sp.]HRC76430.1 NAD(P)-dependent oxidoreductase [Kouleothrix sp.]